MKTKSVGLTKDQELAAREFCRQVMWLHPNHRPDSQTQQALMKVVFPDFGEGCVSSYQFYSQLLKRERFSDLQALVSITLGCKPSNPQQQDHWSENVTEALLGLSSQCIYAEPYRPVQAWMGSGKRAFISAMHEILQVENEQFYNNFFTTSLSSYIETQRDYGMLEKVVTTSDVYGKSSLMTNISDYGAPVRFSNASCQLVILDKIKELVTPADHSYESIVLNFWKESSLAFVDSIKALPDKDLQKKICLAALDAVGLDRIRQKKRFLTTKNAVYMTIGVGRILSTLKDLGHTLTNSDLKTAGKLVDEMATRSRDRWLQVVDEKEAIEYKSAMKSLFSDVDPSVLYKGRASPALAKMMSQILDDDQWMRMTNRENRGKLLADDLGL